MFLRHDLSFEILNTGNPKTLVFVDTSYYFEEPESPIIQVIPPGFNKYFVAAVIPRKVNTFNSGSLGISELVLDTSCLIELADGVWTITYRICPYDKQYVQQYHLRTVKLEKALNQIFDMMDHSDCTIKEDEKLKKELVDVMILIASGKASAEQNNPSKATDKYQKASKKVNKILDKLSKNC